jgi:hypothetical protein
VELPDSVKKDFPAIEKAAKAFLQVLPGGNIRRDISLAAEMAGLKLLRATNIDLSPYEPGGALLGPVSDHTYELMRKFMHLLSVANGIDPSAFSEIKLPDDLERYLPEVVQLESPFEVVCQQNSIKVEHYPYVATFSAMIYVITGKNMNLFDPTIGLGITMYYLNAASKTIPYPLDNIKPT